MLLSLARIGCSTVLRSMAFMRMVVAVAGTVMIMSVAVVIITVRIMSVVVVMVTTMVMSVVVVITMRSSVYESDACGVRVGVPLSRDSYWSPAWLAGA